VELLKGEKLNQMLLKFSLVTTLALGLWQKQGLAKV
jgi:hypothetical protein